MLCNLQTPFIQFARTLKNFTSHPTARMILCTIFALFTFKSTHFISGFTARRFLWKIFRRRLTKVNENCNMSNWLTLFVQLCQIGFSVLFERPIVICQKSFFSVHWVKQIKKRRWCLISCFFPFYNILANISPSTLQCVSLINDLWTYVYVKYLNITKTFHLSINNLPLRNYIPKLHPTFGHFLS